jgi:hypothetical protein
MECVECKSCQSEAINHEQHIPLVNLLLLGSINRGKEKQSKKREKKVRVVSAAFSRVVEA